MRYLFAFLLGVGLSLAVVSADPPAPAGKVRVGVFDGDGTGPSRKKVLAALAASDRVTAADLTADDVRAGKLAGFDVVLHPGGSGGKQGKALGEAGRAKERAFIQAGGGYVGVCAGAYLATRDYDWSLHVLDAKVVDRAHWARGFGPVDVGFGPAAKAVLGEPAGVRSVYYHQGPLLAPGNDPDIPDYDPVAEFRGEVTKPGVPGGVMKGTTAVAAGAFGTGRVLCFSPHPESTAGAEHLIVRGVLWVAKR